MHPHLASSLILLILATPLWAGAFAAAQTSRSAPLTVDAIVASPSLFGTSPAGPAWAPNSRHLAFLWNDAGRPQREIWIIDGAGSVPRRAVAAPARSPVTEMAWMPDSAGLVFLQDGDVWRVTVRGGDPVRLTETGGNKSALAVSPDGRYVSFLQDGDLWLYHQGVKLLARATRVGAPPLGQLPLGTYYAPDVEIGQYVWGGAAAYRWSPDSRYIAVQHVDRQHVRQVPFPYYLGDETTTNVLRRGYPGDENEARTIGFYHVADGELRLLELPETRAIRIVNFEWSPSGVLLIDREADTAVDRWLLLADPQTGTVRQVWHDHRPTRVYTAITSTWHWDGERVLFVGDLDDRYRLYALDVDGGSPVALTGPAYDVTGDRGVTLQAIGAARAIFFVSNEASPYERHVYRLDEDAAAPVRLTTRPGTHTPLVSPDGQRLALLSSDDVTPTELYLTNAAGTAEAIRVTVSPPRELQTHTLVRPRYVSFDSRLGDFPLHARIFEPANMPRGRKHPVLLGPVYSNTVRNRWSGLYSALQQLLVSRGYIVAQVDVRGSTGYGRAFREEFLMDWGGEDIEDLHSTVEYLAKLPYVDSARVGIWGSSYGGTLTVFALFKKPGVFRAGVAGAPAVDPRFFGTDDVAIARRPQSHPEAFVRGKAIPYAENLRDHLLIIHGMMDDVVPFKTTVDLAEHLMRLGKDFEIAFAPAATHGWTQREHYARYLLKRLVGHFDRYLGAGLQGAEPVVRPEGRPE